MITGLTLPFRFDSARLQADLSLVRAGEWQPHYNANDYGGEWRGVALRSIGGASSQLSDHSGSPFMAFSATDILQRCGYFREVLAHFPCPLKAVRLLSLAPGSFVREHCDPDLGYENGEMRIHVPIRTSADVEFYLAGERLALGEGNCYYLNVSLPHRIANRGSEARIHLIIDIVVDEWAHEIVKRGLPIERLPHRPLGFEYFRRRVLSDSTLADRLHSATDMKMLRQTAVATGSNLGFDFSVDEIGCGASSNEDGAFDRRGWFPVSARVRDEHPVAEWVYFGRQPFTEQFFDESARIALRNPFAQSFRFEAPLFAAEGFCEPRGFIFHMSRCGSTLVSRALAALPRTVAISEAPAIDAMVQTRRSDWIRNLILAFGPKRESGQERYFVKFDAWHIHYLSVIREAFPNTPWLFIYRDPLEVLVSQLRSPGMQALPGAMDPAILGMEFNDIVSLSREEWCARVLAGFLQSAVGRRNDRSGMFVDYRALPQAIWGSIAEHFQLESVEDEIQVMRETAQFHAKSPAQPFAADSAAKQLEASCTQRTLAEKLLYPLYRQLSC